MSNGHARFDGKVVIVSGSSAGIGRATAIQFIKEGAKVTIHGQNTDKLQETQKLMLEAGGKPEHILIVVGPAEKEEILKSIVNETVKKFGKLDVLVNNVGIANKPGVKDVYGSENLNYVFDVCLKSLVKLAWLALPHLEKTKGNIVNISSIGSLITFPSAMYYTMSKAALDHFTKNFAALVGEKGVRVNSLNPGTIVTEFLTRHGMSEESRQQVFDNVTIPTTPLKRVGYPDEMANIILFLASDQAAFMTGSIVVADGGKIINNSSAFNIK